MKRTIFVCKVIGIGLAFTYGLQGRPAASKQSLKTIDTDVDVSSTVCHSLSTAASRQPDTFATSITTPHDCSEGYLAQVPPPSERFPQPQPNPEPLPSPDSPATPATPSEPPTTLPANVFVADIQVTGSTVFDTVELDAVIASYEGRSLTSNELAQAADAVTQLYLENGYITTQAALSEQTIVNGVVEIQVIEGELEKILIEGNGNLRESYIRDRVALATGRPLNQIKLEEQLRLLQLDENIETIEASLQAGSAIGQSILTVRVQEASAFDVDLGIDNYSPDSVGSVRVGAEVGYRNLLGIGDKLFSSARITTTGGSEVYQIGYRAPLNAMDGTLQLRFTASNFEITDDDDSFGLDIDGSTDIYDVSFRQPIVRSLREEFALSLGFRRREGATFISGINVDNSDTSVIQFGQDYLKRDLSGAWALRSQFNIGTDLFGITERSGDAPDGTFLSWLAQVQRVQILNDRHTLIFQGDLQLAADPLLPSEQFILGGGQSLRGYEQNSLFGDNGLRFSVEDRITLKRSEAGRPVFQLAPFLDLGTVWNHDDNDTGRDEDFLVGLGTGLLWEPVDGLDLRLDLAIPLSSDGDEQGVFFSVNYRP